MPSSIVARKKPNPRVPSLTLLLYYPRSLALNAARLSVSLEPARSSIRGKIDQWFPDPALGADLAGDPGFSGNSHWLLPFLSHWTMSNVKIQMSN